MSQYARRIDNYSVQRKHHTVFFKHLCKAFSLTATTASIIVASSSITSLLSAAPSAALASLVRQQH
eukprot:16148-Heterococcus_DN1.PRE.1